MPFIISGAPSVIVVLRRERITDSGFPECAQAAPIRDIPGAKYVSEMYEHGSFFAFLKLPNESTLFFLNLILLFKMRNLDLPGIKGNLKNGRWGIKDGKKTRSGNNL